MKIVALWLATLTLAVVAAGSCSVNHRSNEFACQRNGDCADDRVCVDGLCVSTRPPPIDAGGNNDGGFPTGVCPANCTACDAASHTCMIECLPGDDTCARPIACAPGWNCTIDCLGDGACQSGIDCRQAASCDINCFADKSCRNVTCGAGDCSFTCNGTDSCSGISCGTGACNAVCNGDGSCHDNNGGTGIGIDCGDACSCNIQCDVTLGAACLGITCPGTCTNNTDGCTARRNGCNTCP